ncbi:hypothetical protein CDD82_1571 [Ophiocordyceps australis]|uniref:DUF7729 domain-containing protein n=1 Tax=Ophiocordyceps australis TaxID=1399860 RepID=A0A2C5XL74_9HYPO|nr:hypothetical protein CDD82_1571 [Ophiocordyceps australis]
MFCPACLSISPWPSNVSKASPHPGPLKTTRVHMSLAIWALFASLTDSTFAQQLALAPQVTFQPSFQNLDSTHIQTPPAWTALPIAASWGQKTDDSARRVWLERREGDGTDATNTLTKLNDPLSTTMVIPVAESTPVPEPSAAPLPVPFDDAPPSDFKAPNSDDRCPNFISSLLANPTFKSCYPVSMMIQTSRGFFEAEKQLMSIVRVLDNACRPNVDSCAEFLDKAAQNLTTDANCKTEIDQGHSRVLQAWRGLKAYRVLYTATCLQDETTNAYCFANAVTNLTTPSDSFLYFLPYGLALPGASAPTCSWCTKQTMQIFQAASANRQHFIASKYEDAANQINVVCGPDFVNSTLPKAETGVASAASAPRLVFVLASALAATLLGSILTL